jgi:magnesium transporter
MHTWLLKTTSGVHTGGEELFDVWKSQPGSLLWLDIEGVGSDSDRDMLDQKFGLAEADVEDAFRVRHPPAFEGEGERLFLLLKLLDADSHTLDFSTQQMAMFADRDFVITRHDSRSNYLLMLRDKIRNGGIEFESPHQVVAGLARRMVDRYGKVLLDLEERLDTVEDVLFVEFDEGLMQELVGYNTALRKMRRILNYHMAITQRLSTYAEQQQLGEWVEEYEDVATQAERFNSLAELYQNVINDLIEGYISLNGHNLNQVMKVLTVVTVIFVPLTLLVGIYGMNFENMPELKSTYGYFTLLGVMAFLATGLFYIFRRKHWL